MPQIFSLCVYEKLQGLSQKDEIYLCHTNKHMIM